MVPQVDFLGEAPVADGAGEGFLSRMDASVHGQVALLGEALPADVAFVRPLARVDGVVHPQVGIGGEGPAADLAAVLGLALDVGLGNGAFVSPEQVLLREPALADAALVHGLSLVDLHV